MLKISELEKLVDFKKLKACNALCLKWSKRFGQKQKNLLLFCVNVMKDIPGHMKKLPVNLRCQFKKDCKVMFYAASVESLLIEQYKFMVKSLLRKNNIPSHLFEHHETDGLVAIRAAVWNYLEHKQKASFTTYVYHSIFNRIRQRRMKDIEKQNRRDHLKIIFNFSDLEPNEDRTFEAVSKYSKNESCNIDEHLNQVAKVCQLNDREAYLLQCFANRLDGSKNWYKDYGSKYMKNPCKNTIRNELRRLQTKVFYGMRKNGLLPSDYLMPRMVSE